MKRVRKLRHWKQQFDKNAKFIWRKPVLYGASHAVVGDAIPEDLFNNKHKLRNFWEAQVIELSLFEEPKNILNPAAKEPEAIEPEDKPKSRGRPKKN